jgi:hypothetical protein
MMTLEGRNKEYKSSGEKVEEKGENKGIQERSCKFVFQQILM